MCKDKRERHPWNCIDDVLEEVDRLAAEGLEGRDVGGLAARYACAWIRTLVKQTREDLLAIATDALAKSNGYSAPRPAERNGGEPC